MNNYSLLNSFSSRFPKTHIYLVLTLGTLVFAIGFVSVLAWYGLINFWNFLHKTYVEMLFFSRETLVYGWRLNLKELRNLKIKEGNEK